MQKGKVTIVIFDDTDGQVKVHTIFEPAMTLDAMMRPRQNATPAQKVAMRAWATADKEAKVVNAEVVLGITPDRR